MQRKTLYIKNMVCRRCIKVVGEILQDQKIDTETIDLGEVKLSNPLSEAQLEQFSKALISEGFELIDDNKSSLISAIKRTLIQWIHHNEAPEITLNLSQLLSDKFHKDYQYLSKLFSETENLTIEKFVIYQKVEKIKELLVYDELNLNEIAFKMGYSSAAYLSAQFKKVTGFTPSHFKKLKQHHRRAIDEI